MKLKIEIYITNESLLRYFVIELTKFQSMVYETSTSFSRVIMLRYNQSKGANNLHLVFVTELRY